MIIQRIGRSSRRAGGRVILAYLLAAVVVLSGPVASSDAIVVERPVLVGFASRDFRADIPTYGQGVGVSPAIYQLFWDLDNGWPNAWAAGMLGELEAAGVGTAYVEITSRDLAAFLRGDQDAELAALVASIGPWLDGAARRGMLIAPFPEANLSGHTYGGNPDGYRSAYLKVRDAFRSAGLGSNKVRFVFAMNGLSSPGLSYDQFYPGDDVVDIVAFSKVNRGTPWRDFETTFAMHIAEMQQLTLAKPILIGQTASVTSGGNRDVWLQDLFQRLPAYDQVIGAIYYNGPAELGMQVVTAGKVDPAFSAGARTWSVPDDVRWLFDGRMDEWVAQRPSGSIPPIGPFTDIGGSPFVDDILWAAQLGITKGCNPPVNDRFCPDSVVTRGQMAAFLVRAMGLRAGAGSGMFVDDDGSVFEADIERLAFAGVTKGCNPPVNDRFCPDSVVTREQMAAFLHRARS